MPRMIGAIFARPPRPTPNEDRRLWVKVDRMAWARPSRGPS